MASYVKFKLEDGTTVYIESAESPRGSGSLIPRSSGEAAEHTGESFEKSIESVSKLAAAMMDGLRAGYKEEPVEIAVSFGLKAAADVNDLVVSRTGPDGNFNVSLRWRKDEPKPAEEKEK